MKKILIYGLLASGLVANDYLARTDITVSTSDTKLYNNLITTVKSIQPIILKDNYTIFAKASINKRDNSKVGFDTSIGLRNIINKNFMTELYIKEDITRSTNIGKTNNEYFGLNLYSIFGSYEVDVINQFPRKYKKSLSDTSRVTYGSNHSINLAKRLLDDKVKLSTNYTYLKYRDTKDYKSYGLGANYYLNKNIEIGCGLNRYITINDNQASIYISYSFGKKSSSSRNMTNTSSMSDRILMY
jgi:hypothetical protein